MDFFAEVQPVDEDYLTQTSCRKSLNAEQMANLCAIAFILILMIVVF